MGAEGCWKSGNFDRDLNSRPPQKEKESQLVDQEVQQLKQEVKTLDHGNLEMMKVVKEYEKAISEVIGKRNF